MPNAISKTFTILKEQPIGCFFAVLLSFLLISTVLAGMLFIAAAIISVPVIKDTISAQTGFHASVESVFLNIYTGECNLNYLSLQNPQAYNMSEYATESNMEIPTFAIAKSVKLRLSPSDLILRGRLVVKSADIDIDVINCVRINSASYNLPEFIEKISEISEIDKRDGNAYLEKFSIKIKRATYCDMTISSDIMKWDTALNFKFEKSGIKDAQDLISSLTNSLNKANAPFIARGLTK